MSKVDAEQSPFLRSWDERVREFSQFFQIYGASARDDLNKLRSSPLTSWKDVTVRQSRY